MAASPRRGYGFVNLNSDGRRAIVGRLNYQWGVESDDSWEQEPQLQPDSDPERAAQDSVRAVAYEAPRICPVRFFGGGSLATQTYGSRYIFGGLSQTTVSLETRVNVTFTPTLSSSSTSSPSFPPATTVELKEFERPGRFKIPGVRNRCRDGFPDTDGSYLIDPDGTGPAAQFGVSDRDFSYRSLIGNAVLRWEWRPARRCSSCGSRAGSAHSRETASTGLIPGSVTSTWAVT